MKIHGSYPYFNTIDSHKGKKNCIIIVKMIVMANNLDQYGAIDAKLQEIIDLAKSEGVPLFFEFTKRSLGKAIGKSIKIAVIGIQNADGAHQPFKKLNAISSRI
mmetsp:Transcript_28278/g.28646  ORF Transcript_28278/g.28646 Transcript_28278/m.28646 type:complete len:104 (-) Transcript_28278:158-469(-)